MMMILTNSLKFFASLLLVVLSCAIAVYLRPNNNKLTIPTDAETVPNSLESVVKGYPPSHPRLLKVKYDRPQVRFTPWADLTSRQQNIAM
jgi:hypothetical protein